MTARILSAFLVLLLLPAFASAANTHSTDIEVSSAQSWSITDASQSGLDLTGSHSICGWLKFESTPASGANMYLVTKINTGTERSYWLTARNQGGTLRFEVAFSSSGASTAWSGFYDYTFSAGTWYHVCYTYSTTGPTVKV
jgi:hypothetical protein